MNKRLAHYFVFFLPFFQLSFARAAKNETNLAPHVHGEGKLNFVVDFEKQIAELNFKFPALQVLGFEHKPKSDQDKKIHSESHTMLKTPENIFTLISDKNSKSECVFGKSTLKIPYMDDHAHHGHEHDHADYELTYTMSCKNIKAVRGFNLVAFKKLKSLDKLKVEGFVGDKVVSQEMQATKTEFIF